MGRIKLYNHSRMDDKLLYALLQAAAVAAGVKGPVVVKIGRGGRGGKAYAKRAGSSKHHGFVPSWFLAKRSHNKVRTVAGREWGPELRKGKVATAGGFVVISPRLCYQAWNPVKQEWIWVGSWRGIVSVDGQEISKVIDGLHCVEYLWDTALHEFHHIYEFQHGGRYSFEWSERGWKSNRRPNWWDRPEEQRAVKAVEAANRVLDRKSQAKRRAKIDEIKLALAIHLEEVYNK